MKTKYTRLGKRTMSVILSVMMVVSTMLVANVGTLSASADDSDFALAANSGDIVRIMNNASTTGWSSTDNFKMKKLSSADDHYISVKIKQNTRFGIYKNATSYGASDSNNRTVIADSTGVSKAKNTTRFIFGSGDSNFGTYRIHYPQAGDGLVTASTLYQITVTNDTTKGSAVVTTTYNDDNSDPSGNYYFQSGETVTIAVTPNSNYTATLQLDGNDVEWTSGTTYTTSALSAASHTFSVQYESNGQTATYPITKTPRSDVKGTTTLSASSAARGSTFTVTYAPATGRMLDSKTVTYVDENEGTNTLTETSSSGNVYTYTMPNDAVSVEVDAYYRGNIVYFDNSISKSWGWDNVYIYAWDSSNIKVVASTFPGDMMTNEGNNLWSYDVPTNAAGMMFDFGSDSQKTGNITTITNGDTYNALSGSTLYLKGDNTIKEAGTNTAADYSFTVTTGNIDFTYDGTNKVYYADIIYPANATPTFKPGRVRNGETAKPNNTIYKCLYFGPSSDTALTADTKKDIQLLGSGAFKLAKSSSARNLRVYVTPTIAVNNTGAKLWYSSLYTISKTTSGTPRGTLSVDKSFAVSGETVTLTVSGVTTGYIPTAKVGSTAVTLTETETPGTYVGTYAVKKANVTFTVSYAENKYTGLSAVGKYSKDGLNWKAADDASIDTTPYTVSKNATEATPYNDVYPTVSYTGTNSDYAFVGWYSENGSFENASLSSTRFIATANNAQAQARFALKYNATIIQAAGGTISFSSSSTATSGSYPVGQKVKIYVTPASGKILKTLTLATTVTRSSTDDQIIDVEDKLVTDSNGTYYEITMPAGVTNITPTFIDTPEYTVTIVSENASAVTATGTSSTAGGGTNAATVTVKKGDTVTATETAVDTTYFAFKRWDVDGSFAENTDSATVFTNATLTIHPNSDLTITAQLTPVNSFMGSQLISNGKYRQIYYGTNTDPTTLSHVNVYNPGTNGDSNYYYSVLGESELKTLGTNMPIYFAYAGNTALTSFYVRSLNSSQIDTSKFSITIDDQYSDLIEACDPCYTTYVDSSPSTTTGESYTTVVYYYAAFKIKSDSVKSVIVMSSKTDTGYKFKLIPMTENLGTSETVTVYAKNGTYRSSDNGRYNKFSLPSFAVTKMYNYYTRSELNDTTYANATYAKKTQISVGDKIIVETQIQDAYKDDYYVKAFVVNGNTYNMINESSASADGKYSFVYTVTEDDVVTATDGTRNIEITPVYFMQEKGKEYDYVTFYVEDYYDAAVTKWGNTVACYAWYGSSQSTSTTTESLGGYPGQPLVYDSTAGKHLIQVKKKFNGYEVSGITLNNYIWDDIHTSAVLGEGYIDNSTERSKNNCQTYDYDDFVVLSTVENVDTITFRFKYHTFNQGEHDDPSFYNSSLFAHGAAVNYPSFTHYETSTTYTYKAWGTNDFNVETTNTGNVTTANGAYSTAMKYTSEPLTNQVGEKVDLFHHVLSGTNTSTYKVISEGYMNTYFGYFGTLWRIYDTSGAYVGTLPSSALFFDLEEYDPITKQWKIKSIYQNNTNYFASSTSKDLKANAPVPDDFLPDAVDKLYNEREAYWQVYRKLYRQAKDYPVDISFESAIYAAYPNKVEVTGTGSSSVSIPTMYSQDPARRCDGIWFYTKNTDLIESTITIEYKTLTAAGTLSSTWSTDTQGTAKPYTGSTTAAKARFTDNGIGRYQDNNNDTVFAYYKNTNDTNWVVRDLNSSFEYSADLIGGTGSVTLTGDTSATPTKFVFQGWYKKVGDEYETLTDAKTTEGEVDKLVDSKLVARYVEMIDEDFNVNHKLLKTDAMDNGVVTDALLNTILASDGTTKILPHDANGTTTVSKIEILDSKGSVVTEYTNSTDTYALKPSALHEYALNGYKLRVTLNTAWTSPVEFLALYDKESGRYYKSDETAPLMKSASTTDITNSKTNVYTVDIKDLFGEDGNYLALSHKSLEFRSDLTRYIDLVLKYYDRDVSDSNHGQAADMSSEDKQIKLQYPVSCKNTVEALREEMLPQIAGEEFENKLIENVLDEYYCWFTQEEAFNSIKAEKYFAASTDKTPSKKGKALTGNTYADFVGKDVAENATRFTATDLYHHTNKYGNPITTDGVNWVTFYQGETPVLRETDEYRTATGYTGGATTNNLTDITKVQIWLYNSPKTYTVTANYTNENGAKNDAVISTTKKGDLYIDNSGSTLMLTGFYNQRTGVKDEREGKETVNGVSNYLTQYGVTEPYFKSGTGETEIKAAEKMKTTVSTEGDTSLKFDGWYVLDFSGSYRKISSERSYQNRIVSNMVIYAGYVEDDGSATTNSLPTKDDVKVTITENATDKYATNDGEMVRFNTQINVSGAIESDPNIRNVAVLYYNLPTKDSKGNAIDWTNSDNLEALETALKTDNTIKTSVEAHLAALDKILANINEEYHDYAVKGNVNSETKNYAHTSSRPVVTINITDITFATTANNDQKAKIDCYAYEIVKTVDNSATAKAAGQITLTNKNRMQFTWYMTLEEYKTKPFLAFAAIKYVAENGVDYAKGDTTDVNGNQVVAGSNWIVSDNFVTNAFKAIKGVQSSGSVDESFIMKKLAIYTSEACDPNWVDEHDETANDGDNEINAVDLKSSNDFEKRDDVEFSENETLPEESDDSQTETVKDEVLNSDSETVTDYEPAA